MPHLGTPRSSVLPTLAAGDLARCSDLCAASPSVRLIGISRNGAAPRHVAGCFATLPRKAAPSWFAKRWTRRIANIELAQRERAARAELARAEREMEELNRIGVALSETHEVDALLNMILTQGA